MNLNQVFYHQKLQHVNVDSSGVILNTECTLFNLEIESNIKDFNPIFETVLNQLFEENLLELVIPGLRIKTDLGSVYCDVRLKTENGYVTILFFNYTSKYRDIHFKATIKNKSQMTINQEIDATDSSITS